MINVSFHIYILKSYDRATFSLKEKEMNIPILYEDNHLLIVEKPVNIPVQEDQSGDNDLLSYLKQDLKERYQKPGNVYLGLVHRLDRPVGGAIVFAKTSKAASRMADLLRKQEIKRTYYGVVRGEVKTNEQRLMNYLWKDRKKNEVYVVNRENKDAKKAILDYKVIGREKELSLLKVHLQTGRSHQIRVQLQHMGHPLYGDQKYGSRVNKSGEQIALWAYSLGFVHPVKKEWVEVVSTPPVQFPWNAFKKEI